MSTSNQWSVLPGQNNNWPSFNISGCCISVFFFFFLVYSYHLELLKLKFPKIQSLNFFIFMSTLSLLENSLISMASNHLSTEYTQVDIFTMILCLRLSRVYTNSYLTTSLGSRVIMLNLTCPKFSSWTPTFPQTDST